MTDAATVTDGKLTRVARTRIAVVNSHPIQYFAPLYAYLNSSRFFDVTALYCSDLSLRGGDDPGFGEAVRWDLDLLSGYNVKFLGKRAGKRTPGGFWSLVCPEIWAELRSGRYDVVLVHGHNYAVNILALLAAKLAGLRVMMRCETHLDLKRGGVKKILRQPLLSWFYRLFDRCLAIGTANSRFYESMGVPDEKIVLMPYAVDNDRFVQASSLSDSERQQIRARFGIRPEDCVVLYASKFQRRKRPDDLLRAIALLRSKGLRATVLMVGSGEMRAELEQLSSDLGLHDVVFPGFVNQSELPKIFGACDLFVLPSQNEPWGLVVNEVMCAGLPVVVADEVGCVADLVRDGENGFVYKAGDVEGLAWALQTLLEDDARRLHMGALSRERIRRWSYSECCAGLEAACR